MKVSGKKAGRVSTKQVSTQKDTQKADKIGAAKSAVVSEVNVVISERSKEIDQAKATLKTIPNIRIEKVTSLKGAIDKGSYHVDSKILAKRIVNEALLESLRRKK